MQDRSPDAKVERSERLSGALGNKERAGAAQRRTPLAVERKLDAAPRREPEVKAAAKLDALRDARVVAPRRIGVDDTDDRPAVAVDTRATMPGLATLHAQVAVAESLRRNAERNDIRYADQATALRHRDMLGELAHSARRVEETAPALSRRDRAIAKYLIASANVEAADVERRATEVAALRADSLASLDQATVQVRSAQRRIAAGKPPLDYRAVRVLVLNGAGNAQVSGLRVYALPKDMIERPERYPPELLRELLHDLTLENLTSPSQGWMPLSDLRIWVGPEYAYEQMQKLVQDKKLVQYKPMHAQATSELLDLVFRAPDDVPQPGTTQ